MSWLSYVTLVGLFYVLLLSNTVSGSTAIEKFMNSTCGKHSGADSPHREMMLGLLPTPEFWDFFANRTSRSNIMLVDVDRYSWDLLLNEVVALRKTGSGMANHVYAIGYDKHSCGNLTSAGVACYYNSTWQDRLASKFKEQSRHLAQPLHMVMMGRMMTSVAALCEGHNVFLSDTDVVFYRDPIQYTFRETDMMIAATRVKPELKKWGGTFFTDHPDQYFTLNNGVVFYRSNPIMQHFVISLAEACLKSLKGPARQFDYDQGFLQKVFNKQMVDAKLTLGPTSKFSDPVTFRLNTRNLTNTVGECYDCHYGTLPWPSSTVVPASPHNVLKIGVFPLTRFTSFCWAAPGTSNNKYYLLVCKV